MKSGFAFIAACAVALGSYAQQLEKAPSGKVSSISLDRLGGGSVKVDLGYGITLNKDSSLKREWFVVRDESAPAYIEGNMGVSVQYKPGERSSSGQYIYSADYILKVREAISAVEARVIVIDAFGRVIRTLSTTELLELNEGQQRFFTPTWRIYSEAEASEVFASIAYVAQVRTQAGKVYEIDRSAVLDQVRKVTRKITADDLDTKREQEKR